MLHTPSPAVARFINISRSREAWAGLILLAILAVLSCVIQLSTYPNHDVSWILWGTREMVRGSEFGVDIIEPNPPLAWYLSAPTTIIAMQFGLPLDWTFRIAVAVAGAAAAGAFAWLLSDGSRLRFTLLCVVAGLAMVILPAREFGQREHLAVIVTLPYLALVARRIGSGDAPPALAAALIGIAAGLGFALKPYFLAIPALVELSAQLLARRRLRLFRPENLSIGAVVALYLLVIVVFEQDYLWQSVPLADEIYWSFNRPWAEVGPPLYFRLFVIVPIAVFALFRRDDVGILLAAACAGFILSYVVQQKGYAYHLLPISVFALLLLAHLATSGGTLVRIVSAIATVALFAFLSIPGSAWWQNNRPGGPRPGEIQRIVGSVALNARNGKFLIVSVHPYPTFPTAIYTPAHHVSRTNSHWFLPAIVQIRSGLRQHPESESIERHAREFILHDLSKKPDLVLIDRDSARHTESPEQFDFLAFYLEDPSFRTVWRNYREIEPLGSYRQFIRTGASAQ